MDGKRMMELWRNYREANPRLFEGTARGHYLQNRIEHAFLAALELGEKEGRDDGLPFNPHAN